MEHQQVPHLRTAGIAPLSLLEKRIIDAQVKIETWFRQAFQDKPTLITSSVDIRNAGFKIAPVDTNLFPAGFNNLSVDSYPLAIQALQFTIEKFHQKCQKILIIPENHTRNPHYFESLSVLSNLLMKAGFEIQIGSLIAEKSPITIQVSAQDQLTLMPVTLDQDKIIAENFRACMVLLNNDLSDGIPDIIMQSKQLITPPPQLGWKHRLKSMHFEFYKQITEEFSKVIDVDPWYITPEFEDCGEINFVDKIGEECLIEKTERLFQNIRKKYKEYNIERNPFVVIKANQGTYGMAVMMVQSSEELKNLNRKQRQKMAKSKGGQAVNHVIIQEGVHTIETVGEQHSVAEPVVYMIGNHVVGGFYRVHMNKGPEENLNAPGMHFEPLAFDECCNNPDNRMSTHASQNKFYVYSVIARLALLATCYEAESIRNQ
ncbi:glutamate--cysteine ligase [Candidatus Berkiella cookevillensis]|uniref:Glutamate--cysteine ligase n=1 Tax=Candidatus Berkiella cookevillensis TaxID=437022 RepID=A0A0Q9YH50_9GAMM|nr:glutamate--cysteine ligase [Candidatus Berkiella cookevillensis]MCS5708516.1 glutamate--cysteine ligase [Candidatus Berkiella cookevillensis]